METASVTAALTPIIIYLKSGGAPCSCSVGDDELRKVRAYMEGTQQTGLVIDAEIDGVPNVVMIAAGDVRVIQTVLESVTEARP